MNVIQSVRKLNQKVIQQTSLQHILSIFHCNLYCRRFLLSAACLGLSQFQKQVSVTRKKLGRNEAEFKTRFVEKLGKAESDLLKQECSAYVYLMNEHDVLHATTIVNRRSKQLEEDKIFGLPPEQCTLLTDALRQCHIHRDTSTALSLYHSEVSSKENSAYLESLLLVLDLLYETQQYESCANIVKDIICDSKMRAKVSSMTDLKVVFTFGLLSSFKMDSATGLNIASSLRLQNIFPTHSPIMTDSKLLLALYGLKQKRFNATLSILQTCSHDLYSTIVKENMVAMVHMELENSNLAFRTMISLESKMATKRKWKQFIIFADVFKRMLSLYQDEMDHSFLKRIRANAGTLVNRQSIEEHLTSRLSRSVDHCTLANMIVEDEEVARNLVNSTDQRGLDNSSLNDTTLTPLDSSSTTPNESSESAKPKGDPKVKIVDGYIVFTYDEP